MENKLTINSPYLTRLAAWSKERFPLANILTAALGYAVIANLARTTIVEETPLTWKDGLGIAAYVGQLLLLRILDEFKDYESDKIAHPQRVLQRGIILLSELRPLAIISALTGLAWSFCVDQTLGPTVLAWLLMMGFTYLMTHEFFMGKYLRKNLFLYGLSHSFISVFITFWLFTGARKLMAFDYTVLITMIISLSVAMSYEITRKTFGPKEEHPHQDSYSKEMGISSSLALTVVYNLITFLGFIALYYSLYQSGWWPYLGFLVAYSCTFYPTFNMFRHPSAKARKLNEGGLGLFLLLGYLTLLISLLV
jgi:4-hydroxybenzoate polyprenyltransferase